MCTAINLVACVALMIYGLQPFSVWLLTLLALVGDILGMLCFKPPSGCMLHTEAQHVCFGISMFEKVPLV